MNALLVDYLRRKNEEDSKGTLPEMDLTDRYSKGTLPEMDLTDRYSKGTLPEMDLTDQNSPSKLRDDNSDSTEDDTISPKTHSGDSASAQAIVTKSPEWRQLGDVPPPPLVRGDDEQSRQVWEYLKAKMDDDTRLGSVEDAMLEGARKMAASLGGHPEPRSSSSDNDKSRNDTLGMALNYLSVKNKDDASERALEQRATAAEGRVRAANDRLALEKYLKDQGYEIQRADEKRKEAADASQAPLIAARVEAEKAKAEAARAKAKAAAAGAAPGSRDVPFDNGMLVYARRNPDKQVSIDDQKKVHDKASAWNGLLRNSDKLTKDLAELARHPGADTQGRVRADVALMAQGVTYAVGGGAMQTHEAERAESALGVNLTNPNALKAWLERALGNPDEAAREMTLRVKELRPLARDLVSGFAESRGFDFKEGTPKTQGDAGGEKVTVIDVDSGLPVQLSRAAAEKLKAAGKVRDQ